MAKAFLHLLIRNWVVTVDSMGTTTLGLGCLFLSIFFVLGLRLRQGGIAAVKSSWKGDALINVGATLGIWLAVYFVFFVYTIYNDHTYFKKIAMDRLAEIQGADGNGGLKAALNLAKIGAERENQELKRTIDERDDARNDLLKNIANQRNFNSTNNNAMVGQVANFRFSSANMPSSDPNMPFLLRFTILTDTIIIKPAFIIICDGPISQGLASSGAGSYSMMKTIMSYDNRSFGFRWDRPDFVPESPITAYILSKELVHCNELKDARLTSFVIEPIK